MKKVTHTDSNHPAWREAIEWCIEQHTNTNHYYDEYLPYDFHLRMVANVAKDFMDLANKGPINKPTEKALKLAAWGHDLIEDCRVSYNDCKERLGEDAADIIYAVTNEKGKNRKERANDKYYEGIRNTPGAVFVKLCDRIANVQYSKMTKSRMFEMYKNENENFIDSLGGHPQHELHPMFDYLINLFETK